MRLVKLILPLLLALCLLTGTAWADSVASTISVFKKSPAVRPFFKNAYGYAVFPQIGKGGIFVGAAYGSGRVYRQGRITGTTSMTKVSLGFQLGGQVFSQIIFFQNEEAYYAFTRGNFEFDASASAVVITAGAQARVGTQGGSAGLSAGPATGTQMETRYLRGMAVFVHTQGGLMYEASIGGQKFDFQPL
ncbi:MAG: lipid-binding SYLF domain-containing protein [Desulfobacterales bacterium]|nr:lipid-binding SYLF domain-containing protein [Desulfobacterales bacterium]